MPKIKNLEGLVNLEAKVETGTSNAGDFVWFAQYGIADIPNNQSAIALAMRAHGGSFDAAHVLHKALVPRWEVDDLSVNGRLAGHPWGIRMAKWDINRETEYVTAGWGGFQGKDLYVDYTPGCAYFVAILRALIADNEE